MYLPTKPTRMARNCEARLSSAAQITISVFRDFKEASKVVHVEQMSSYTQVIQALAHLHQFLVFMFNLLSYLS